MAGPLFSFFFSLSLSAAEKKRYLLLFITQLHLLYSQTHDSDGHYYPHGTVEYLQSKISGGNFKKPIGLTKFTELKPKDIDQEGWRTCCCQICYEIDTMMTVWGLVMSYMHSDQGTMLSAREPWLFKIPQCADASCVWKNGTHHLPHPFPERFKNIITSEDLLRSYYPDPRVRPPFLFCSGCKCGACEERPAAAPEFRGPIPPFLSCRRIDSGALPSGSSVECLACGWEVKYVSCPTLERLDIQLDWRCLFTTAVKNQVLSLISLSDSLSETLSLETSL